MDYKLRLIGQSRQCEPIQTDMIIAQGHHHFDASIEAREVNTTGSCIMNEMAQIKKLKSGGHLQMNQARLEHFHARGSIKARCYRSEKYESSWHYPSKKFRSGVWRDNYERCLSD